MGWPKKGSVLGPEGSCLDPGFSPAPQKKLLPSDAQALEVHPFGRLRDLIKRGGQKIGEKIERLGERIKGIFTSLQPREES